MGISGTTLGVVLGLGVQFYSNAARKLPLWRNPWEHAIAATAGGFVGNWLVKFEEKTAAELEVILEKRQAANDRLREMAENQ